MVQQRGSESADGNRRRELNSGKYLTLINYIVLDKSLYCLNFVLYKNHYKYGYCLTDTIRLTMREVVILVVVCMIMSCNTKLSDTKRIVAELYQKEIIFPKDMVFVIKGDTVKYDIDNAKYKILTYADSADCIGCRLKLCEWNYYLSNVKEDVKFVMVINNSDINRIISQTKYDRFNRPICIDDRGKFIRLNEIPDDIHYQTFLLDSLNHIILIGNPLFNGKVDSLYSSVINN